MGYIFTRPLRLDGRKIIIRREGKIKRGCKEEEEGKGKKPKD